MGILARQQEAGPSFTPAPIQLRSPVPSKDYIKTVPALVEYNADRNANHPFCVQIRKNGQSPAERLLTVTHGELKDAVTRCQEWLLQNVAGIQLPSHRHDGRIQKGAPVALFMESDVGLWIYVVALMGLGVSVVLLSARLNPVAVHHLLKATQAETIISAPKLRRVVCEIFPLFGTQDGMTEPPVQCYIGFSYESFLSAANDDDKPQSETICYPGYYISESDCSAIILHSSGTTGLPKPVYQPHRWLLSFCANYQYDSIDEATAPILSTLPVYHGAGLVSIGQALGVGKTVYLPPPSLVSTGASTLELLNLTKARAMFTVPSTLEEMTLLADNKGVSALASLQFVAFGGGRLKPSVGEALSAAGVRLLNHYGTTETGSLSVVYIPEPEDWSYFRLRDDIEISIQSVDAAEDGVTQQYKLVARPFGWDGEFEIQDQLVRNPKHPATDFTTVGRNDALIVFATGKKLLPDLLESMLSEAKNVKAAIAYGEGQFELVVLIEPSVEVPSEELDNFKASLWPIIEEAGNGMEAHARIASKDAVIVIPQGRSFPRTDKASIMRKEVYRVFDSSIAETYRVLDSLESDGSGPKISLGAGALEQDLKNLIQTQLNWRIPPAEWRITDDLFELGMDSLQALHLRRLILRQLPARDDPTPWIDLIPREFVYMHPSVAELATAIRQEDQPNGIDIPTKECLIEQLVQKYSLTTKVIAPNGVGNGLISGSGLISGNVILMTGTTGSLGSQLLSYLVGLVETSHVICLNRVPVNQGSPEPPLDRQQRSLKSRGISISEESWRKVSVFETNTYAPLLGLGEDKYADLKRTVTHIIHNAWPMDFKRQILSFKPQFSTIQNFLTLCRDVHGTTHQRIKPALVFVSSIAVVGQYSVISGDRIVPEKPMADSRSTNAFGYAEGKLVGEKILEHAASVYSNEMTVKYVRCGQIAGSKDSGCWSTTEYFPALVKSSQTIGALPMLEGTLSWLPVDQTARALSDITLGTDQSRIAYHLENPIRQAWEDILSVVADALHLSSKTSRIPFQAWLDKVNALPDGPPSANHNPAKTLMDFFQNDFQQLVGGSVILDTYRAREASATLRKVDALDRDTIFGYVRYWKSIGFLK